MKRITTLAALAAATAFAAGHASAMNAVANGGFEIPGAGPPDAQGWQEVASGYNLSNDALSGNFALELNSPTTNRSEALQNSVADGGLPSLVPGQTISFSFWSKGFAGTTGFAEYRVAFLDATGAIVNDLGFTTFSGDINENTWTEITRPDEVVPAGANAVLVQFGQSIGPIEGELLGGSVLVDDVSFTVVPEPSSLALLGLGGFMALRRRR